MMLEDFLGLDVDVSDNDSVDVDEVLIGDLAIAVEERFSKEQMDSILSILVAAGVTDAFKVLDYVKIIYARFKARIADRTRQKITHEFNF
jgi:hypothetical protein